MTNEHEKGAAVKQFLILTAVIAVALAPVVGIAYLRWWGCTELHPEHVLACMVIGR